MNALRDMNAPQPSRVSPVCSRALRPVAMAVVLACLAPFGCSRPQRPLPPLGRVTGVVTLDGKPLARAAVAFVPYERGNGAYATTDAEGRYTLRYTAHNEGAVVGRNRVEIRTGGEGRDADGNLVETPEQLPARYHATSQLVVEVAAGDNEFDFALVSGPEKRKSSR
jgi:hypothetical protein